MYEHIKPLFSTRVNEKLIFVVVVVFEYFNSSIMIKDKYIFSRKIVLDRFGRVYRQASFISLLRIKNCSSPLSPF